MKISAQQSELQIKLSKQQAELQMEITGQQEKIQKELSAQQIDIQNNSIKIELFDRRFVIYKILHELKYQVAATIHFVQQQGNNKTSLYILYLRKDAWSKHLDDIELSRFLFSHDVYMHIIPIEVVLNVLKNPLKEYPDIETEIEDIDKLINELFGYVLKMNEAFENYDFDNKIDHYLNLTNFLEEEFDIE